MKLKVTKYGNAAETALISKRGLVAIMAAGYQKTRDEDAAEIARRCNAFDDLLQCLSDYEAALEDGPENCSYSVYEEISKRARLAIATATQA